jgi:two-component system chemotaxis sensor kinase CheA
MANDSLLDVYLFENMQLLDKLESVLLECEKKSSFSAEDIADIFRVLHTVKGSSAMMNFDSIAGLSHALEDLFDFLRGHSSRREDHHKISDLVFQSLDVIKAEISKIQNNGLPDGDVSDIIKQVRDFHQILTGRKPEPAVSDEPAAAQTVPGATQALAGDEKGFKAHVIFQQECKMENIRALGLVKSIEPVCPAIVTVPADLLGDHSDDEIIANGFTVYMLSLQPKEALIKKIRETFFIQTFQFDELSSEETAKIFGVKSDVKETEVNTEAVTTVANNKTPEISGAAKQSYLSVNLSKLDMLMDIVGEIVITEATVIKNPKVLGLHLESFDKASRQLHKLTEELQDIVMSIRMVPVSATFHKMERIVRDMSNKFDKKAQLEIIGEDTELDKNVLDNLSDPLMHLIRNSMDHGLESSEDRVKAGKNPVGTIRLEARNSGSDVLITISDDGRGLNKNKLIEKGIAKGLIKKPKSEVTDKEAYALIFAPGFSTKEEVTEFSGRGVGMDVVMSNIEKIGGSLSVDSTPGQGMSVIMQIPLTLAIIDGMQVSVGGSSYIIPLLSIRESFKPKQGECFADPDGREMIWLRGNCYPIIRLHKAFNIETDVTDFEKGILVTVETQSQVYCLFVDELVGEQKTVVKPIPTYITKALRYTKCLAGCTILGDGSISLILDINGLLQK